MTDNRNLFNRCLHLFRDLDNSWQGWVALHNTIEEIVEDALDLAIDQVVNLKLVQTICLSSCQAPGPPITIFGRYFLITGWVTIFKNSCALSGVRFSPKILA